MGMTNFASRTLVPALRSCGLTSDDIARDNRVQDVVYLLERTGFDLGFQFKWEMFGPFSYDLASEIDELGRPVIESSTGQADIPDQVLNKVTRVMQVPDDLELSAEAWLRLIVCVDFVERRCPGITQNGQTPPYIVLNFHTEAITEAREQIQAELAD